MGNTQADISVGTQRNSGEAQTTDHPTTAKFSAGERAGLVEPHPEIAQMVRQGILKARDKLIDLSLRNGMLHYRLSETSSRHVRIIDVQPEFLVKELASGHSLNVAPIPPVDVVPRDEDTAE